MTFLLSLMMPGQQVLDRRVEVLAALDGLLQLGGDVVERLGDDRVEHRVRARRSTALDADGAELELVAGEGERAGAVAVAGVAAAASAAPTTPISMNAALLGALGAALLDLLDDVLELSPRKIEMIAGGASLAPRRWSLARRRDRRRAAGRRTWRRRG